MDTGSPEGLAASKDANRPDTWEKLYTEPSQCNCRYLESISVDELGNSLTESLSVQDDHIFPSNLCQPYDKTDKRIVEMQDECEDSDQIKSEIETSENCLSKYATFPCSGKKSSFAVLVDGEDDITVSVSRQCGCESVKPAYPQSISLPTPLKLVSAMKGSREKQGTPQKLTVTWAPDVYDPPPSAPTLLRNNKARSKNERRKKYDKKNGKNKQKGRSSKGSKEKKQVRRYGESSYSCYQWPSKDDTVVDSNEPCGKLGDLVGSPDVYCGSSFFKKSITKLHFSIAEAK